MKEHMTIVYNNEEHSVDEWSRIRNISRYTLRSRIRLNWSPGEILGFEKRLYHSNKNPRIIEFNGEAHTIKEWAKIVGMKESALRSRLSHGWSIEIALSSHINYEKSCGKKPQIIYYKSEGHSVPDWSRITGIPESTIRSRIRKFNWPIGQALGYEKRQ